MKNKEKFKKICNIISKVLLIIFVAFLIFIVSVALFKSCNGAFTGVVVGLTVGIVLITPCSGIRQSV